MSERDAFVEEVQGPVVDALLRARLQMELVLDLLGSPFGDEMIRWAAERTIKDWKERHAGRSYPSV